MQTCPNCGRENPADARFCNACAASLAGAATALPEERKIVTILFVDLVGFTARAERLDPEDVRAIQAPYFARVREAIESFGGTVEKYIGDAVMAVFGAPVAHGDDPERAVRAALAILDAVDDLDVRIAVNTGEALVSVAANPALGEGIVSGDVVNTTARLQAAAPSNGILVGEETYRATRSAIAYDDAPPVVAKGKEAPVHVWRALAAQTAPGERVGRVPMVGRSSELETLTGIWDRVVSERRPQLVTLFGPGGIGKSRLSSEFADVVQARGGRAIRGRSLPYGEMTPYGSFAAQIKQLVGMFDTDDTEVACAKLERAVEAALRAGDARDVAAHLAMLIGVGREGAASDRQTLFYSARRYVEALAEDQPTLLVFEDIHVAASSLLDLLEMLASRVRDVPLLLLTQARPELLSSRPAWGGGLPAYTTVQLEPLAEQDARELARRLFETAGADARRLGELAETAEGNPLFVEELVASLAEGRAESGELPTSIRSIVAARIDALPAREREALLDAAVVGKVFWPGAVAGATAETLDALEGRDLIRRDPVSRLGAAQAQFTFKHQLIRDVAYATLPRARRRERHETIAVFLEEAVAETGDVAPALGHHWHEAGDLERAARYYVAAGDQAGRGWAKEQAALYYQQALGVISEDDRELRREVAKRYAVAAQASLHLPEMLAGRGGPRSAENRPE
jgi:class 3 adenylate cyclase